MGILIPAGLAATRAGGQGLPAAPTGAPPTTPAPSGNAPQAPAPTPPTPTAPPKPTATVVWSQPVDAADVLELVTTASRVVAVVKAEDGTSHIEARDMATGAVVWTSTGGNWRSIEAGDATVFACQDARLVALDADTGRELWTVAVSGSPGHISILESWVVATGSEETVAIARDTGAVVWRQRGTAAATGAAIAGSTVAVGFADRTVVGFDLPAGTQRWRRELDAAPAFLTAGPSVFYATTTDGQLCAFRAAAGQFLFCFNVRVPAARAPIVLPNGVYGAFMDNALRSFDPASGALHRPVELGARPAAGPFLSAGSVLVLLNDGAALRIALTSRAITRIQVPYPNAASSVRLLRAAATADGAAFAALTVDPNGTPQLTLAKLP